MSDFRSANMDLIISLMETRPINFFVVKNRYVQDAFPRYECYPRIDGSLHGPGLRGP